MLSINIDMHCENGGCPAFACLQVLRYCLPLKLGLKRYTGIPRIRGHRYVSRYAEANNDTIQYICVTYTKVRKEHKIPH